MNVQQNNTLLIENIRRVNAKLQAKNEIARYDAQVLSEALDKGKYKQVTKVLQKLSAIKGSGLQSLDAAIEKAQQDVNAYAAGGLSVKGVARAVGDAVGAETPVDKAAVFASALEAGFGQIKDILTNNLGQFAESAQIMPESDEIDEGEASRRRKAQQQARQPQQPQKAQAAQPAKQPQQAQPADPAKTTSTAAPKQAQQSAPAKQGMVDPNKSIIDACGDDTKKQDIIKQTILKALRPSGAWAAIKAHFSKSSTGIPYVDNKAFVEELMNVPIKTLSNIHRVVTSAPLASEIKTGSQADAGTKSGTEIGTDQDAESGSRPAEKTASDMHATIAKKAKTDPDTVARISKALLDMGFELTKKKKAGAF